MPHSVLLSWCTSVDWQNNGVWALASIYYGHISSLDSFMWESYPASLRNVCRSTQVPVRAWNARKSTWGLPPPVKLECRHMIFTVSVRRKTDSNKQNLESFLTFYVRKTVTDESSVNSVIRMEKNSFWTFTSRMVEIKTFQILLVRWPMQLSQEISLVWSDHVG
jgi:hypothetical protein